MISIKQILILVKEQIRPIRQKLVGIVSRGTVSSVDDTKSTQTMQVRLGADESTLSIDRLQPFGFSSVPLPGADALHLSIGGNRANGVVVACGDSRYRPSGYAAGTVCLHTQNAVLVVCRPDGTVELGEYPPDFVARADKVLTELNKIKTAFDSHTHIVAGVTAGPASVTSAVPASPVPTMTKPSCEKVKAK